MIEPKYIREKKDPWMLAENIPDSDIFFFQIPFTAFVHDTSHKFIKSYKKSILLYKGFHMDFYFGQEDSFDVAESILEAIIHKKSFGEQLNKNIIKWSKKLKQTARDIAKQPLGGYSNKKLWELYEKHDEVHTKLYTYGWLPVSVDVFHNNFTNRLKQYLYSITDSKNEAEDAFILFTTPTKKTILAGEQEEFLKVYDRFRSELKTKKVSQDLKKAVEKHQLKWGHLGYIYAGNTDPFTAQHYLKELRDLAKSNIVTKKFLIKEKKLLQKAKREQSKMYRRLDVNPQYRKFFEIANDFALTKLVRRDAQLFTLYWLHQSLLPEIAKRLNLTRYQVQFMLMREVKEALLHSRVSKKLLQQRLKSCVYYIEPGLEEVYVGAKAKSLEKYVRSQTKIASSEIKGQVAFRGKVTGKVKIIIRAKDMKKMKKGDILVSIATDPDVVPAMKKAAAIVTEQGGITSHAAIVSRELETPCIIGTKIATKVLKDGDLVEVDAEKGVVRKI